MQSPFLKTVKNTIFPIFPVNQNNSDLVTNQLNASIQRYLSRVLQKGWSEFFVPPLAYAHSLCIPAAVQWASVSMTPWELISSECRIKPQKDSLSFLTCSLFFVAVFHIGRQCIGLYFIGTTSAGSGSVFLSLPVFFSVAYGPSRAEEGPSNEMREWVFVSRPSSVLLPVSVSLVCLSVIIIIMVGAYICPISSVY